MKKLLYYSLYICFWNFQINGSNQDEVTKLINQYYCERGFETRFKTITCIQSNSSSKFEKKIETKIAPEDMDKNIHIHLEHRPAGKTKFIRSYDYIFIQGKPRLEYNEFEHDKTTNALIKNN